MYGWWLTGGLVGMLWWVLGPWDEVHSREPLVRMGHNGG